MALAICIAPAIAFADDPTIGSDSNTPATAASAPTAVTTFSQASQSLYHTISLSLVRVRMEPPPASLLPQPLRKEFEEWRRTQLGLAPRKQRAEADTAPATMPARTANAGGGQLLRRWLEMKLNPASGTDADTTAKLRAVVARLQTPPGDMLGVVLDAKGDIVVLGGAQSRDAQADSLRITSADGVESTAKYIGTNQNRGFTIVRADNLSNLAPIAVATERPAVGELLMSMSARQGSVQWITEPASFAKKGANDRFALPLADGSTYLFNAQGQLSALGFNQFALPIGSYKIDIAWIIENQKDVQQRQLGVRYAPVPPDVRKASKALASQTAVVIEDVAAGSLAEKAGLQKNDILIKIDRHPIWQMQQIQMDLATQNGTVPVEILRNDKDMTVDLPLQ